MKLVVHGAPLFKIILVTFLLLFLMSQRLFNVKSFKVEADSIEMIGPTQLDELAIEDSFIFPGDLEITDSKDVYVTTSLVDTNGVIPTGRLMLKLFKLNDMVFWEFVQISTATYFTCGATANPLWATGSIPTAFRPSQTLSLPLIVHEDAGAREGFELVIGAPGGMSINAGISTLFTSG